MRMPDFFIVATQSWLSWRGPARGQGWSSYSTRGIEPRARTHPPLAMRQMAQDVGTLVGASSMGAMALAHGIPSAMVAVATMQGAAALFFALRVPRTPARGPNRRPVSKE